MTLKYKCHKSLVSFSFFFLDLQEKKIGNLVITKAHCIYLDDSTVDGEDICLVKISCKLAEVIAVPPTKQQSHSFPFVYLVVPVWFSGNHF